MMARFEAAVPELRAIQARAEEDIGRLGPPEPSWATTGLSPEATIAAGSGTVDEHVLGEWEQGGHGVSIAGDRPLGAPARAHRYTVRGYEGPIGYHNYHRVAPGLVIHMFGAATRIGNAECQRSQGIELIAHEDWRSWSARKTLQGFGMARATRDDPRTYCMLYRPAAGGGFAQVS